MNRRNTKLFVPFAGLLLAASWILFSRAVPLAQAQTQGQAQTTSNHNASREDFDLLMTQLSNWGRWGKDDQKGAVNLITPAKRKQALSAVKDGFSVSMARNAEMEQAVDNPQPIIHRMGGAGRAGAPGGGAPAADGRAGAPGAAPVPAAPRPPRDIGGASDSLFVAYHGSVHSHMDAFCHRTYKGKMYNGMLTSEITDTGCNTGNILAFKDGIITHGVLMDIPRLKGVDWLEPGTRIYPEDLDAWVKQAHLRIEPGDVVLIRTGRWARRDAKGPWNAGAEFAGLYMTCAKWLHQRDVAILGSDAAQDVHPSGIEGITEPIHALVLIAMGMPIFDNLDLEAVAKEAARRNRWDFLVTASPIAVPNATGSPLNPIATF